MFGIVIAKLAMEQECWLMMKDGSINAVFAGGQDLLMKKLQTLESWKWMKTTGC